MDEVASAVEVARVGGRRTTNLMGQVRELDERSLLAPSLLPGWSRLTVICHLRYGASAMLRMTRDALSGQETSYYPLGRSRQRPATLQPAPHEEPWDVLTDWERAAGALDHAWASLESQQWATPVVEPENNPDLGTIPLARLALARLTEIDLHGTDLDVGFPDWCTTLVEVALPARLSWLATRRSNHRELDKSIAGTWWLLPRDGPGWLVSVHGGRVQTAPAVELDREPDAVIAGTSRDLLALLLGRPTTQPLQITGDVTFGESFRRAFPGP